MLISEGATQAAKYDDFVSGVEVFQHLNNYEKSRVASVLEPKKFEPHADIVVQGETGDLFFLLEEGTCGAFIAGDEGEKEVKQYTQPGEYFGEIALLTAQTRQATVVACEGPLKLLTLDRKTFKRVLGPLEDVLRRNMESYKKIRAQHI